MSDSVRPHRRQPTRLPCPWNAPGKNTGMGCHFLLQCMKVKSESEITLLCPTLSDPMGLQPSRLLRPWDFPGKSAGVGCHCLLPLGFYSLLNWRLAKSESTLQVRQVLLHEDNNFGLTHNIMKNHSLPWVLTTVGFINEPSMAPSMAFFLKPAAFFTSLNNRRVTLYSGNRSSWCVNCIS